jgi:HEAT repeat protein
MQIYAAQALLSLGDQSGIPILWKYMDHDSWVVRAMAARYLGDYGQPDDYVKINSYLNRETRNDYVMAELCLASLKLISRKGESISYSPSSPGWKNNDEVSYTIGKDKVIELEPLIIVPPQLRIPASLQVAAQINAKLNQLITTRLNVPLDPLQAQDPVLQDLNAMVTPTGFALKTRYSELSYLVIEALAGTNDMNMRATLQRLAADDSNPLIRASALIALAYSKNEDDLYLIQQALSDKNAIARMGALEAIEVGRFRQAIPDIFTTAGVDPCPAIQVYALQVLAKFDNPSGRQSLINRLSDPDWPTRAMAYWYLGRYGTPDDYSLVLSRLMTEENPFVQAEIVLAVLRLTPVQ